MFGSDFKEMRPRPKPKGAYYRVSLKIYVLLVPALKPSGDFVNEFIGCAIFEGIPAGNIDEFGVSLADFVPCKRNHHFSHLMHLFGIVCGCLYHVGQFGNLCLDFVGQFGDLNVTLIQSCNLVNVEVNGERIDLLTLTGAEGKGVFNAFLKANANENLGVFLNGKLTEIADFQVSQDGNREMHVSVDGINIKVVVSVTDAKDTVENAEMVISTFVNH